MMKWLRRFFKKHEPSAPKPKPIERFKPRISRNELLLSFASGELGTKEIRGSGSNARVEKYHAYARLDNTSGRVVTDDVPWCASFICFCLEMVGMGSTNSKAARSFLKWGVTVELKDALPGDLVVYYRGQKSGWSGHVGIFLGMSSGYIITLGGNQADAVRVSKYSTTKLLSVRRSSKMMELNEVQQDHLWDMAAKVRAGNKVDASGKVV